MNNIKNITNDLSVNQKLIIAMFSAYLIQVFFRIYPGILPLQNGSWHVINTAYDGFSFMASIDAWLNHTPIDANARPINFSILTFFSAWMIKLTGIPKELVFEYLPPLLGSMVVIPVLLLGKKLMPLKWAWIAAITGGLAIRYFQKTMLGGFDYDMIIVPYLLFVGLALIKVLETKEITWSIVAALMISILPWIHPGSYNIGLSFIITTIVLMLVFFRLKPSNKELIIIGILLSGAILNTKGLSPIAPAITMLTGFTGFALYKYHGRNQKLATGFAVVILIIFIISNALTSQRIINKISVYSGSENITEQENSLKFINNRSLLTETKRTNILATLKETAGSIPAGVLGIAGIFIMFIKRKETIVYLPLLALFIFSIKGGIRFQLYLTPIIAIGAALTIYEIANILCKKEWKRTKIILFTISAIALIAPVVTSSAIMNQRFIINNEFFINQNETKVMRQIGKLIKKDDKIMTWWVDSYPLWYYAGANTFTDGGKNGKDNFLTGTVYTADSQLLAANLIQLMHAADEEIEKGNRGSLTSKILYSKKQPVNVASLLNRLKNNPIHTNKRGDSYLFISQKDLRSMGAMLRISGLNPNSGKRIMPEDYLYEEGAVKAKDGVVFPSLKAYYLWNKKTLTKDGKTFPVKYFITVREENGKNKPEIEPINPDKKFPSVIYFPDKNIGIIAGPSSIKSNLIKMFVLNEWDKNIFKLEIDSTEGKLFKVKKQATAYKN